MSDAGASDAAFELLAEGVQRQLYRMGWKSRRPVQAAAIQAYMGNADDLLIMAETAGGKTEAAFLPVLSSISEEAAGSVRAVYVGPLKALINDQFGRLEELCTYLDVPVHRWHGDVGASSKSRLIEEPGGVLLITPESLESLLINRTSRLAAVFGGLRAVVIDEVHAFLDGERGVHLSSLLTRLGRYKDANEARTRVIGLSATVGDPEIARAYLSPGAPARVRVIADVGSGKEVRMRVHAYVEDVREEDDASKVRLATMERIAADLAGHCRGQSNLVFANSKGDIELYADMANAVCRCEGTPETFLVHHGSLARDVREETEETMKGGQKMTTVCSSTLEMGIDIGSVRMVGQIGPPWSVASFKQRLGRSGRRDGEARRVRGYIICDHREGDDALDGLPLELLQTVAVCELMLAKWVEPPSPASMDLSTLTHQVISTIAEMGGVDAAGLHTRLCGSGPFSAVEAGVFARMLRALGKRDVLEQGPDGKLILGLEGERIRKRHDFYAAFATEAEYTLVAGDRVLGTLPVMGAPAPGDDMVFAGRRWRVEEVDAGRMEIRVVAGTGRARTKFRGGMGEVHSRVREEMLRVLCSEDVPVYLDETGVAELRRARSAAKESDLVQRALIDEGKGTMWITWTGTKAQRALMAVLAAAGIKASDRVVGIECTATRAEVEKVIWSWLASDRDAQRLAAMVGEKRARKFDGLLDDALLEEAIARDMLDIAGAEQVARETLGDRG